MLIACYTDHVSLHQATYLLRFFPRYDKYESAKLCQKRRFTTYAAPPATSEACTPTETDSNSARVRALTARARRKSKPAEVAKPSLAKEYLPTTSEAATQTSSKAQHAPQQGRLQPLAPADILELSDRQLLQYMRNGHLMTSALLAINDVLRLKAVVQAKVELSCVAAPHLPCRALRAIKISRAPGGSSVASFVSHSNCLVYELIKCHRLRPESWKP